MRLTSSQWGLKRGEFVTTYVSFAISTSLYLRDRHDYLARGVLGDLVGFVLLASALAAYHRRFRHEALVCLAAILVVLAVHPEWPVRMPSTVWWLLFALGFAAYVVARRHLLRIGQ